MTEMGMGMLVLECIMIDEDESRRYKGFNELVDRT